MAACLAADLPKEPIWFQTARMGSPGRSDDHMGLDSTWDFKPPTPSLSGISAAAEVIPLTVFELGRFETAVDWMGYVTFCYWLLDLPGSPLIHRSHGCVFLLPGFCAGSFLVGSDMEGTLEMRPGPIASAPA